MNTRPAIDESTGPISLTSSTLTPASSRSPVVCLQHKQPDLKADGSGEDFNAGIGATEMLGKANYIALVGGGKNPRFPTHKVGKRGHILNLKEDDRLTKYQLIVWDDAKQVAAVTLEFRSQVLQARLSRSQILVALLNSVSLYAFSSPPKKVSTFETADNPSGLCCLGSNIIAFPGRTPGQVQLVEISTGNVSIIPAHGSSLKAMTLSPNGQILATASEIGTLIRLFSTTNCARISELRRGVDPAAIFSLAISPSNTLLAVTSDKATLHIFDLPHPNSNTTSRSNNNSINAIPSSRSSSPYSRIDRPLSSSSDTTTNKQKWGILGKLPLLPRLFSDTYSFASAPIAIDDDP
ncbi:MAG: hypothetical protein Q9226_008290, partial [Calogaya cf. arnoldii]